MLALIATTMAVVGLLTSGANTAGEIYDKAIIDDSLNTMQNTVEKMQDRAEEETDPVKKQEKLLKAQSLNETEQKLRDLNEKFYKMNLTKEAVGVGRNLVSPIKPKGMKELPEIVETVGNALSVADTSVQTINSVVSAQSNDNSVDARTDLWAKVADTNDECEIQIMIAKARQLTKEAKKVKAEATEMADYYRKEKSQQLTSRQVEDKLAQVVDESPTLQTTLLEELDEVKKIGNLPLELETDEDVDPTDKAEEEDAQEESNTKILPNLKDDKKISDNIEEDIIGTWKMVWFDHGNGPVESDSYRQFFADGTANFSGDSVTYEIIYRNDGPIIKAYYSSDPAVHPFVEKIIELDGNRMVTEYKTRSTYLWEKE